MSFNIQEKKSVLGPVISVFVTLLVVAVMAGLTFIFIAGLKTTTLTASTTTPATIVNESGGFLNLSGYVVANAGQTGFSNFQVLLINNQSNQVTIGTGNYTVEANGRVRGTGLQFNWTNVNITYSFNFVDGSHDEAYGAINGTESAGAGVVSYLPLIFLALIFGVILTLVLRTILPFIDLGNKMGGF